MKIPEKKQKKDDTENLNMGNTIRHFFSDENAVNLLFDIWANHSSLG